MQWSEKIQPTRKQLSATLEPPPKSAPAAPAAKPAPSPAPQDSIRVVCSKCQNAMRIPLAVLRGKTSLNVRCPQCQNVMTLRSKPTTPSASPQK
jgi:ribosomal protein S27E